MIAIIAGFGMMDRNATPSEKQASQQIGNTAGLLGMASMFGRKVGKKAADVTNNHFTTKINMRSYNTPADKARRHSAPAILDELSSTPKNTLTTRTPTTFTEQIHQVINPVDDYINIVPVVPSIETSFAVATPVKLVENFTMATPMNGSKDNRALAKNLRELGIPNKNHMKRATSSNSAPPGAGIFSMPGTVRGR
jgi:hypothetical protein